MNELISVRKKYGENIKRENSYTKYDLSIQSNPTIIQLK